MKKVNFAIVGVRNFAWEQIKFIKAVEEEGTVKLAGAVVRDTERNSETAVQLEQEGVKIYHSYEQLLTEGKTDGIDIIALPVEIASHSTMAIQGMKAGFDILLEKPPVPTIEEMDAIIKTEKETGQTCSIGFQLIHSEGIRRLKEMILDGKIGELKSLACKGYWPRYKAYYDRNEWAGKTIHNGQIVLDGPMHNALAHFLNNMVFLAGKDMDSAANLKSVRAELYRAHTYIQSDDTSCLEAKTEDGVQINFYVTHAPERREEPYMVIEGTEGRVIWKFRQTGAWKLGQDTEIFLNNGEVIKFEDNEPNPWEEVIRVAAKFKNGELDKPYSTPTNTRSFVVAINGAYDSCKKVKPIPTEYVREFETEEGHFKTVLANIEDLMDEAFEKRVLLSELDVEWAERTETVDVSDYKEFNPFN